MLLVGKISRLVPEVHRGDDIRMVSSSRHKTQDMRRRISNHLRAYRRSRGLTQTELTFLFGEQSATNISRSERGERVGTMDLAFACQVIFGIEANHIYPGLFEQIREEVIQRIHDLRERLREVPRTQRTAAKLRLLEDALERAENTAPQT